jgi:hypothetical protein
MTKQETFKKRIRTRMAKTGERYVAARRSLIEAASQGERAWVSQPELSDERVQAATGRGWNEWCDLIDGWPGHDDGHTAIAAWVHAEFDVDGWWSQAVTGGYERITGRRLPNQDPDGSFVANKSKTVRVDADWLRSMVLDDDDRRDLFPGVATTLRSKPESKSLRVGIGGGVAIMSFTAVDDGRARVSIQHRGLATVDQVDEWKFYWSDWLEALDQA